jgi:tRNA (guanine-N(7)-)-methyltransferase
MSSRVFRPEKVPFPRSGIIPEAQSWKFPLDQAGDLEIDLEIGCGVGWHPIRYAKENPKRVLIAIEHTVAKFESFQGRVLRNREKGVFLKNLYPIHADAVEWITHFVPAESLSRLFLLYPNPWHKKSDHHRRWHELPFFSFMLARLKPGGELVMATNIRDYAESFAASLRDSMSAVRGEVSLRELAARDLGADGLSVPRTHFEKKYLSRGETCYEVHARLSKSKRTMMDKGKSLSGKKIEE